MEYSLRNQVDIWDTRSFNLYTPSDEVQIITQMNNEIKIFS